jgi:hypothetical protein
MDPNQVFKIQPFNPENNFATPTKKLTPVAFAPIETTFGATSSPANTAPALPPIGQATQKGPNDFQYTTVAPPLGSQINQENFTDVGGQGLLGAELLNQKTNPFVYDPKNSAQMLNVGADMTTSGQLEKLLSSDNPYIKQARLRAEQQANSRGLLNSSIAAGNSEAAAIQSALPIAQSDASTFFNAAQGNQAVTNQFGLDGNNKQFAGDQAQRDRSQQLLNQLTNQQFTSGEADKDRFSREKLAAGQIRSNEFLQQFDAYKREDLTKLNALIQRDRDILQSDLDLAKSVNDNALARAREQQLRQIGITEQFLRQAAEIYAAPVDRIPTEIKAQLVESLRAETNAIIDLSASIQNTPLADLIGASPELPSYLQEYLGSTGTTSGQPRELNLVGTQSAGGSPAPNPIFSSPGVTIPDVPVSSDPFTDFLGGGGSGEGPNFADQLLDQIVGGIGDGIGDFLGNIIGDIGGGGSGGGSGGGFGGGGSLIDDLTGGEFGNPTTEQALIATISRIESEMETLAANGQRFSARYRELAQLRDLYRDRLNNFDN